MADRRQPRLFGGKTPRVLKAKRGTLPLAWGTRVETADVICHVSIDGEPIPKGRPRHSRAYISKSTGQLVQPHDYTPERTRQAEEDMGWALRASRRGHEPVDHPVGVLVFFRTRHATGDADNLAKLVLDAANNILWTDDQQVSQLFIHVARHCPEPGTDLLVWVARRRTPQELSSPI